MLFATEPKGEAVRREPVCFTDFRLIAEEETARALKTALEGLPLNSASGQALVLALDETGEGPAERFQMSVAEDGVSLTSPSLRGLFHGLTNLKWLMFEQEGKIEPGEHSSAPRFEHRGVFLDVSRGKRPALFYLKDLVVLLADLKYNILQLYFEDKFLLPDKPRIGGLTGGYSRAEIEELDAWCKAHQIELQPCIQTFSHYHGILSLPEYSHLAENENLFSLAAGKPEVYDFLEEIISGVMPWFTSRTIHLNMDEAYDLGTGYSKQAVEEKGAGPVYLDHLIKVAEIARRHGAEKVLVWGDIALHYPEILDQLPSYVVLADWNYNPLEHFSSLETMRAYPGEFWAAGGISTWNTLFPRVYNAYTNLINYSVQARESGAKGFLITDWGDYGHFQPLGLSLYGYLIGAQQSYHASSITSSALEEILWPLIFKDVRVGKAFRALMDSNKAPFIQTDFKSMSFYYFFDDLFSGLSMSGNDRYPRLLRDSFEILAKEGKRAETLLDDVLRTYSSETASFFSPAWERLFGTFFLEELRFSARTTRFTGEKGMLSVQIKERFESKAITAPEILDFILRIKELYTDFIQLRYEFVQIWNKRSYWDGIETSLLNFDKAGVQFGEAVRWLSNQYRALQNGMSADYAMESYVSGKKYRILWTADFKDMWESAYPWQ